LINKKKLFEDDKILVFCIFFIEYDYFFAQVFNLVYIVGNIIKWKWNCNVWWNL